MAGGADSGDAAPTSATGTLSAATSATASSATGRVDASLEPSAAAWAALLGGLPHAAWVVQIASRRVAAVNAAAAALFGRPCEALVGASSDNLLSSPEELAWWAEVASGELAGLVSDTVVHAADGRLLHVSRSIGLVAVPTAARATHALVVLSDRSAEQRSEDRRESLVAELQATLEATADGILVTDLGGRASAFNHRFAELWAMPMALLQRHDDAAVQAWMAQSVVDTAAYGHRLQVLRQATLVTASDRIELHSGRVLERMTRPLLMRGRPQGRVWSYRDLTASLAAAGQIEALETHDALTGLPNRRRLTERVGAELANVRRSGGTFALLVIDLDRFRQVNDSFGHDGGDRVLQDVAQRIQSCLRQDDVLVRLSGDQFAVLVAPADAVAAASTARRILAVVAEPCSVNGAQFTLTCSVGASLAPSHGGSIDDLVRHAEAAMRAVKSAGRANYRLHQMRAEVDRRSHMLLDHAMRQALVSGRFRLHYQPQLDLASGAIVGAEALLRWRDPELGEVPPARFIPVAEDSGFIVAIGDWVLGQAVRQAARWLNRGHALTVSVNVSALQFQQSHFVERLAAVLAASGLPPGLLELELTESVLVQDADDALQRLHALAHLGLKLSIDDFGTGYSSLAYLKRFPIGKLRIDRSFVQGLPADDSDAGIVRAIVQMAAALGMRVIAEGVETEAQRHFLKAAGCHEFQGFLYAPALDSRSFEQRLLQSDPAPPDLAPRMRLIRS